MLLHSESTVHIHVDVDVDVDVDVSLLLMLQRTWLMLAGAHCCGRTLAGHT